MSYSPKQDWDPYGQEPRRPNSNFALVVIVLLLVLGIGGVFLVGVVTLVAVVAQMDDAPSFDLDYADLQDDAPAHPQDWAAVRAGFDPDAPRPDLQQLARMQTLLDEYVRCSSQESVDGLQKIVDYSKLYRELLRSRFAAELELYDRSELMRLLSENLLATSGWQRIQAVGVQPLPAANEFIVYAYGYHDDSYANPVRFWVTDGRTLRLYDWELVDYGRRESGDWAVLWAYNDRRIDAYLDGMNTIDTAEELWSADDIDGALAKMEWVERQRVPPPHHDQYLLQISYTWLVFGRNDKALAAIDRMENLDATPGGYFVKAEVLRDRGELEKALKLTEKYEGILGPTIESLRLKAAACRTLGRWEESQQHRRQLVKIMPADVEAIVNWATELPEDQSHLLAAHVETLDDPVAVAVELANRFAYRDDDAIVRALADIAGRRAPDSVDAKLLAGLAHYAAGDYEAAAPHLRQAYLAADEDQRQSIRYRYLECMSYSGNALKAYEESDSPDEDFLFFAEDYDYGDGYLTEEQMRQLVDAHLQRSPEDPWVYYYASIIREGRAPAEEIIELLQTGLEKAEHLDEDEAYVAEGLRSRHAHFMYLAGRAAEAYDADATSETFASLAQQFRYSDQRPVEELEALIHKHRAKAPDDPQLEYFQALAAYKRDDLEKTDHLLKTAHKRAAAAGDEDTQEADYDDPQVVLRNNIRQLWLEVLLEDGRALDAYRNVPPPEETFDHLATRLYDAKDWVTLESLIVSHQRRHADDPQLLYWQVQLAAAKEQHDKVAALLEGWPEAGADIGYYQRTETRDALIDALLETGRDDQARKVAENARDAESDLLPLIRVCVAAGDAEQVEQLIDTYALASYGLYRVYNDHKLGQALRADEYSDLRQRHPPPIGYGYYGYYRGVLLLKRPGAIDASALRQAAGEVLAGEATVTPLGNESSHGDAEGGSSYVIAAPHARLVVTTGGGPYSTNEPSELTISDQELLQTVKGHDGWLCIQAQEPRDADEAAHLVQRLLARLITDDVAAVHVGGRLMTANKSAQLRLSSGEPIDADEELGAEVWLYREDPLPDDNDDWVQSRTRRLRELDRAFASRTPEQAFHIQVALESSHARELHWLKLVRVKRSGYRDRSFICAFTRDSQLQPRFAEGDYVHVEAYDIENWRITEGDKATLARGEM